MASLRNPTLQLSADFPVRMKEGLSLLLQAIEYAHDLACDVWDFAVAISHLRATGLSDSDFRWLVRKGYVDHSHETTLPGQKGRSFQCGGDLTFSGRTCFVLTGAGTAFARKAVYAPDAAFHVENQRGFETFQNRVTTSTPHWDSQRQQLRLDGIIMKEFKRPSPNQEIVLAAFEEEGWPPRIDDPLPPEPSIEPKRRLQDTIKSLNRSQKRQIVRFMGDGSGEGVRWELIRHNGEKPVL